MNLSPRLAMVASRISPLAMRLRDGDEPLKQQFGG